MASGMSQRSGQRVGVAAVKSPTKRLAQRRLAQRTLGSRHPSGFRLSSASHEARTLPATYVLVPTSRNAFPSKHLTTSPRGRWRQRPANASKAGSNLIPQRYLPVRPHRLQDRHHIRCETESLFQVPFNMQLADDMTITREGKFCMNGKQSRGSS